eukprot:536696_1
MSKLSSKFRKNSYEYAHDMSYNRASLMRMQEKGEEINWPPKPKKPEPPKAPKNPPTVTIANLNIIANENEVKDADKDESPAVVQPNDSNDKKEADVNAQKEDIKKIEIRYEHQWFVMKFENAGAFYEFLDRFKIFGLLAEKDGCLIITHYDDLIGENTAYRTVKFTRFDRWKPYRVESKNDKLKKFYSDTQSIKKKGVCTKVQKTIGIRHNYVWLQLTFRYKWEFDKFIFESECYGLVNEHTNVVVSTYSDLEQNDYRLFDVNSWDQYNESDVDGTYSGSLQHANTNKGANKKRKTSKTSSSWFSSS